MLDVPGDDLLLPIPESHQPNSDMAGRNVPPKMGRHERPSEGQGAREARRTKPGQRGETSSRRSRKHSSRCDRGSLNNPTPFGERQCALIGRQVDGRRVREPTQLSVARLSSRRHRRR